MKTGRGRHRYFRLIEDAPHFIHRDGHTIEFRHRGAYVIGPGSRHPTGAIYTADDWSWNIYDVPFFPADFVFDDRPLSARGSSCSTTASCSSRRASWLSASATSTRIAELTERRDRAQNALDSHLKALDSHLKAAEALLRETVTQ